MPRTPFPRRTRTTGSVIAAGAALAAMFAIMPTAAFASDDPEPAPTATLAIAGSVESQLAYVREWWNAQNPAFPYLDDNDCTNFVNQALAARGWSMTDQSGEWWVEKYGDGTWDWNSSSAWISSTALYKYLAKHPELAIALTDAQRAQVKIGDVIQFDWNPGEDTPDPDDRDHTGIVTKIDSRPDGSIEIYYAGHTRNTLEQSITGAWERNGRVGIVSFWSIQTP